MKRYKNTKKLSESKIPVALGKFRLSKFYCVYLEQFYLLVQFGLLLNPISQISEYKNNEVDKSLIYYVLFI